MINNPNLKNENYNYLVCRVVELLVLLIVLAVMLTVYVWV